MLKTLRKCTWNEIKVGEVFGFDGCFEIYYKDSKSSIIFLTNDVHADDWRAYNVLGFNHTFGGRDLDPGTKHSLDLCGFDGGILYKLPESVQQLWKTE